MIDMHSGASRYWSNGNFLALVRVDLAKRRPERLLQPETCHNHESELAGGAGSSWSAMLKQSDVRLMCLFLTLVSQEHV